MYKEGKHCGSYLKPHHWIVRDRQIPQIYSPESSR